MFTEANKEAKFMLNSPDMNQQAKGNAVMWGKGRTAATPHFSSLTPVCYDWFQKSRNREVSGSLLGVRDKMRSGEENRKILL